MQFKNLILLIDDNEDDNFFHNRVINKVIKNPKVIIKKNGRSGLDYLLNAINENQIPDFVFLDINMPVMDGWSFLEEYNHLSKEYKKRIKIVVLTTSGNPEDHQKAIDFGAICFETKPLTKEKFASLIKSN